MLGVRKILYTRIENFPGLDDESCRLKNEMLRKTNFLFLEQVNNRRLDVAI
jgi:hypothetical protein